MSTLHVNKLKAAVGTTVNIMIRNKQLKGRVIQTPFL